MNRWGLRDCDSEEREGGGEENFLIGDVMEPFTIMRRLVPSEWKHYWLQRFYTYLRKVPVATISCS